MSATKTGRRKLTAAEWQAEGVKRFGKSQMGWRFACPGCGHVASVADYKAAGAPEGAVGFSCIGRYLPRCRDWMGGTGPGPCNYTGGGLFQINPVEVIAGGEVIRMFEFAEPTITQGA